MATYILNINERSKKAKALLQLITEMATTEKSISIDKNIGLGKINPYNKTFIEKINKSKLQSKNGELKTISTGNLWT